MVEKETTHSALTRRRFIKATGVVTAAATAIGCSGGLVAMAQDALETTSEEEVFRGVCRPNCFGYCHLNVHVHEGRVMKTTRAPYDAKCYDRICQRGLSHVQRIYDPKRLQYPLRRVEGTPRGSGQWERVSWDEALSEVAAKIQEAQAQYGEDAVAYMNCSGNTSIGINAAYARFFNVLNASNIAPCADNASMYGMQSVAGLVVTPAMGLMMWNGNEPTDARNAKSIVVWGANITDAQIQNWHLIREAQVAGAKLVVVDPIFTQVASKADKWVPIRPASDTLLKFGLMQIVLEKNAQDVVYLKAHTVAPLLVKTSDGMFLRRSDTGVAPVDTGEVDPTTQQPIMDDPFMVMEHGKLVELREGVDPDIEGSYNHAGDECRCAFDILKERINQYTLDEISQMTEIPLEDIYELADICIDGPVFHYEGYGPQAYNNGAQTTAAGLTLCALLGNLGKPGASYGSFWGISILNNAEYNMPFGPSTGHSIPCVDYATVLETGEFRGRKVNIKVVYNYSGNPFNTGTETGLWLDTILPSIDYLVTADSVMTDTAAYSDMVLPIAQWFELEEVGSGGQTCALSYNEKAIDPPYECKSDAQIIKELAEKLGLGDLFTLDVPGILETSLSGPIPQAIGATYEELKEKKEFRFISGNPETDPYIAYKDGEFATPTGRFEFYRENPAVRSLSTKDPTPEEIERERCLYFVPPLEAWPDNPLYQKYPFVLMSERPRYRVHSQWCTTPLLREIDPEPIVKINPIDAKAKGIEDQTYVECFNDRGTAVAKAVYSDAIRPGTMVYPKGWQLDQHKGGGWSYLTSTNYDVWSVSNNFMDVLCDVRPWEGGEA